jgi:hypothetical protein
MGKWFIRLIKQILVIAFLIYPFSFSHGQTVNVPLSHWIYDVLERWETQDYIKNIYDHTKPYTRIEVAEYLTEIYTKFRNDPRQFSKYDRQFLEYSAAEFAEELEKLKTPLPDYSKVNHFHILKEWKVWPKFLYSNSRNLFTYNYKEFNVFADIILQSSREEFLSDTDTVKTLNRTSNGFLIRGDLGMFGYYFMLVDNHISQEPKFARTQVIEESGWPFLQMREDRSADFDENVAYLTFKYKYFYLFYGRDYNKWGAGHEGNLMLSTNAPIYDQIKLVVQYWRFKLTHITSWIQYIPPGARDDIKSVPATDAFWSGNRIEFYLGRGIQLGLSQSVVYGNRSVQPGYLNPISFYASIEHFYGDRDNTALGFDFAWRIWPGIKVFGEWFIDDIITSKLGTDWFGNKFGYQAGLFFVDPLKLRGTDILIEYTRIKPYVYGHSVADYNKYKHYDTVHGHYIGSNSDDWFLRFRYSPHRRIRLQADYEHYRHGKNIINQDINAGGDPDLPFRFGQDSENAPFLAGDRIYRQVIGGDIQYELLRQLFVHFKYHQVKSDQLDWSPMVSFQFRWNFGYRPESKRLFEPAKF